MLSEQYSSIELRTGRRMPILGLGTWQLTRDIDGVIKEALRLGYAMIDTSGDYGTQPGIAKGLAKSDRKRDEYYIVTKVEEDEDAYEATRKNLEELDLGYADLILIHRPPRSGAGEELWRGLMRAKQEGLTRDIGVSNYPITLIKKLVGMGEVPAVNQIEWSPFGWSQTMLEYCGENTIVIQAYSPLTRAKRLKEKILNDIAGAYGKTPAQLLIRWNIQLGTVPIPKANQQKHLEENIDVFDFAIDEKDMRTLNTPNEGYSSFGGSLPYI